MLDANNSDMTRSILLIWSVMMTLGANLASAEEKLITHKNLSPVHINISEYEEKLASKADLSLPLDQELEMLKQLSKFELGRFLLLNQGLNGYWTSYLILHGPQKENLCSLEKWIIESAPIVCATRERFYIFQKVLHENLRDNMNIASIPCGIMDDLVQIDTRDFKGIKFTGIDYDENSINLAKNNSENLKNVSIEFHKKDAWNLDMDSQFDVITSNGLNFYEEDDNKVIDLYRSFYKSLKPGGVLLTSFLMPHPSLSKESTWKNFNVNDDIKQKALLVDIIGVRWKTSFRTEALTKQQLEKVGFKNIRFIYDSQGMFPTVVAQK